MDWYERNRWWILLMLLLVIVGTGALVFWR